MKKVLLLSSNYEPHSFVDERRAFSLLMRNVVDVITNWDYEVLVKQYGTERKNLLLPAVLRLNKFYRKKTRMPNYRRYVVFTRDDYRCQYCDKVLNVREATIDHIVPRSQGGGSTWKNCVTSCKRCNLYKDDRTPEKAGMTLKRPPLLPSINHFWEIRANDPNWNPIWNEFMVRR